MKCNYNLDFISRNAQITSYKHTWPHLCTQLSGKASQNILRTQHLMISVVFVGIIRCLPHSGILKISYIKEGWNQINLPSNCYSQRGVRRSSSAKKPSLMCPPFVSKGSQGMPFSTVIMFSHLSSASSSPGDLLLFLKAHKKKWVGSRMRKLWLNMVLLTNMENKKGHRKLRIQK